MQRCSTRHADSSLRGHVRAAALRPCTLAAVLTHETTGTISTRLHCNTTIALRLQLYAVPHPSRWLQDTIDIATTLGLEPYRLALLVHDALQHHPEYQVPVVTPVRRRTSVRATPA